MRHINDRIRQSGYRNLLLQLINRFADLIIFTQIINHWQCRRQKNDPKNPTVARGRMAHVQSQPEDLIHQTFNISRCNNIKKLTIFNMSRSSILHKNKAEKS